MKLVAHELEIAAPPAVVYRYLTDPVRFVEWIAASAVLEPVPGGEVRWTHANGDTVSGRYVSLSPDRRVVFSYGWERTEVGIPPASTIVTIDLHPLGTDATRLRLVHRGLDDLAAEAHRGGWLNYLDRLRQAAEGTTPGPDPFADHRVPTLEELRR